MVLENGCIFHSFYGDRALRFFRMAVFLAILTVVTGQSLQFLMMAVFFTLLVAVGLYGS